MAKDQTDLFASIARSDSAALQAALERGADANANDRRGVPALSHAAARGDVAMVQLLLDRGAAVDQASRVGNTALMAATARGHLDVISALLEAGADPGSRNEWDLGAADWAQWPANSAEVRALLHARGA